MNEIEYCPTCRSEDRNGCGDEFHYSQQQIAALQQEVARLRDELEHEQMRGDGWATTAENYKNQAESAESAMLAVREALLFAKEIIDDQAERFHKDCRCQLCESAPMKIDAALSTTSAQAEGIKARLQAEALEEVKSRIADLNPDVRTRHDVWLYLGKRIAELRARAAQLTSKTGEQE